MKRFKIKIFVWLLILGSHGLEVAQSKTGDVTEVLKSEPSACKKALKTVRSSWHGLIRRQPFQKKTVNHKQDGNSLDPTTQRLVAALEEFSRKGRNGPWRNSDSSQVIRISVETAAYEVWKAPVTEALWSFVFGEKGFYRPSPAHFLDPSYTILTNTTYWSKLWFLNELSRLQGLTPVYDFSGVQWQEGTSPETGTLNIKSGQVKINPQANGWDLPTKEEEEFAKLAGAERSVKRGNWFNGRDNGYYHEDDIRWIQTRYRPLSDTTEIYDNDSILRVHGGFWDEWIVPRHIQADANAIRAVAEVAAYNGLVTLERVRNFHEVFNVHPFDRWPIVVFRPVRRIVATPVTSEP